MTVSAWDSGGRSDGRWWVTGMGSSFRSAGRGRTTSR